MLTVRQASLLTAAEGAGDCACVDRGAGALRNLPLHRTNPLLGQTHLVRVLTLATEPSRHAMGNQHYAVIASLVEACKLNGLEPHAYLSDVLTYIADGHLNRYLDELLPCAYASAQDFKPWPECSAYR